MKDKSIDQSKRGFIKSAAIGAGAVAAASVAAPSIAEKKYNWRMVTTWPRNFPGLGVGAQRLADRINTMSNGRLNIRVYSANELVPALQSFDAVIEGSAEMCHSAAYYWQNKSEANSFFTGVPYGMTSRELTAWIRYMGGQEIWDKVYDQFGRAARVSIGIARLQFGPLGHDNIIRCRNNFHFIRCPDIRSNAEYV